MTYQDVEKLWDKLYKNSTTICNNIKQGEEKKRLVFKFVRNYVDAWMLMNPRHHRDVVVLTAVEFLHCFFPSQNIMDNTTKEELTKTLSIPHAY